MGELTCNDCSHKMCECGHCEGKHCPDNNCKGCLEKGCACYKFKAFTTDRNLQEGVSPVRPKFEWNLKEKPKFCQDEDEDGKCTNLAYSKNFILKNRYYWVCRKHHKRYNLGG